MTKTDADKEFRPELQGLRGVAVLLVLFYHMWPSALSGGLVGVDVFFVLSGFLISGLLLDESDRRGAIDLPAFWGRRIRRLVPAAAVVLMIILPLVVKFLPPTRWIATGWQIIGAALYVVNWTLAAQSVSYAERGADPSPVQHYWSLSIEGQFYLVWPVLAFLITRIFEKRRRFVFGLAALMVFLGSLLHCILFTYSGSAAAYFVTTTRVWELALGGVLAAIMPSVRLSNRLRTAFSWTGLLAILVSGVAFTLHMAFPGWIALVPTLGAFAVIAAGQGGRYSPARFLAWKPAQYLGDISYSVYLWHWPLILFLPLWAEHAGSGLATALKGGVVPVLLSLLIGALSKHVVEDPFRRGAVARFLRLHKRPVPYILAALFIVPVVFFSCHRIAVQNETERAAKQELDALLVEDPDYPGAAALDPAHRRPGRPGAALRPDPLVARKDAPSVYEDGCDARQTMTASPCEYGEPGGKRTIVLLGDSHAVQYLPAMERLADRNHWRIVVLQKSACLPCDAPTSVRATGLVKPDCESWKADATRLIIELKPDLVVTTGGMPNIYNEVYMVPGTQEIVAGYRSFWGRITAKGIRVLVIRDNPRPIYDVPSCVAMNRDTTGRCDHTREWALDRHDDPLIEASRMPLVELLDLTEFFCEGGNCPVVIGNVLVYRDGDHITGSYARTLAPYIGKRMEEVFQIKQER